MYKVHNKLQAWEEKLLSYGGKAVLITSMVSSIPIYLLPVINPPNFVIYDLHSMFTRFLWYFK